MNLHIGYLGPVGNYSKQDRAHNSTESSESCGTGTAYRHELFLRMETDRRSDRVAIAQTTKR